MAYRIPIAGDIQFSGAEKTVRNYSSHTPNHPVGISDGLLSVFAQNQRVVIFDITIRRGCLRTSNAKASIRITSRNILRGKYLAGQTRTPTTRYVVGVGRWYLPGN